MKQSSRLADVLHVLLHMAEAQHPTTSEVLADAMDSNPVVLRRLLAGLRDAGLVASSKGHGGGWVISCDLDRTTLLDVYLAIAAPPLVALGFRENQPACLVAQAVNESISGATAEAEAVLLRRLSQITLSALSHDFHRRLAQSAELGVNSRHLLEHHAK